MFWVVYVIVAILYIFGVLWWSVKDREGRYASVEHVSVLVILGFIPIANIILLFVMMVVAGVKYLRKKYR